MRPIRGFLLGLIALPLLATTAFAQTDLTREAAAVIEDYEKLGLSSNLALQSATLEVERSEAALDAARGRDAVLRYVARVDASGAATVGLVELPRRHAFANIQLTDNVVQFTTARYCDNPLVVQGPGAGPEVTATGVFADVLRVAHGLGAHL